MIAPIFAFRPIDSNILYVRVALSSKGSRVVKSSYNYSCLLFLNPFHWIVDFLCRECRQKSLHQHFPCPLEIRFALFIFLRSFTMKTSLYFWILVNCLPNTIRYQDNNSNSSMTLWIITSILVVVKYSLTIVQVKVWLFRRIY